MGEAPRVPGGEVNAKEVLLLAATSHYFHYLSKIEKHTITQVTKNSSQPEFVTDYLQFNFYPDSGGNNDPFNFFARKACTVEYWAVVSDTYTYERKKFDAGDRVFEKSPFNALEHASILIKVY